MKDLLVGEGHVALFDPGIGELGLDADVDGPLLSVVAEVGLDAILKVHDTLCVDLAGRLGSIGQLHLADLGAQDVAEVAIEGGRATGVPRAGRTLGHGEGLLLFDLVGDQIDGAATAVDDEDGVVGLQVQKAGLGTEERGRLGFGDQGQAIIVGISDESGLDGGGAGRRFTGIVPDGWHGQVIADVTLFAVEDLPQRLLQLVPHGLAEFGQVVGRHIDLGFARGEGG